jgi:hypothetical protein
MVSEKQLLANRENAKKGGPRTDEGKAIVRRNAVRHGLLCRDSVLRIEKERALRELRERFIADLQPQGELEMMFLDRIVSSYWRLGRAVKLETRYMDQLISYSEYNSWANDQVEALGKWPDLTRYETTIERQMYKAHHELQRLQLARQGARPVAPIAIDVDLSRAD